MILLYVNMNKLFQNSPSKLMTMGLLLERQVLKINTAFEGGTAVVEVIVLGVLSSVMLLESKKMLKTGKSPNRIK